MEARRLRFSPAGGGSSAVSFHRSNQPHRADMASEAGFMSLAHVDQVGVCACGEPEAGGGGGVGGVAFSRTARTL